MNRGTDDAVDDPPQPFRPPAGVFRSEPLDHPDVIAAAVFIAVGIYYILKSLGWI